MSFSEEGKSTEKQSENGCSMTALLKISLISQKHSRDVQLAIQTKIYLCIHQSIRIN